MLVGDLKSLHSLWVNLARNHRYRAYVRERDIETFTRRLTNEGLPFLTTVLPEIGKALDRFHSSSEWVPPSNFDLILDEIRLTRSGFPWFSRIEVSLPVFLRAAIKFALSGDSVAVDCVRQLTLIFYKYEVRHDEETEREFLDQFKSVDHGLLDIEVFKGDNISSNTLIRDMKRIIARVLCNKDPLDIRPCHGGGATACHTANKDKHHLIRYYPKLDAVYSYSSLFFYNPNHLIDDLDKLEDSISRDPQARVCLVPKDSRGPRVISCEPAELMFVQQGLMNLLYEIIETHPLTSGQVNFTDQTINRELARFSSMDGEYSTIDLSEASDRVSLQLVRAVFPPQWVECFEACRSESTLLPNGEVVKLNKFAPMGSSCCFPVEALVFWACAEAITRTHPSYKRKNVFVYGDDIIIASDLFDVVVGGLTSIGLLVNEHKSYKAGPFRESCGGDYHKGYDVTPVRVRKALLSHGTGIDTNADLCNTFIAKFGYNGVQSLISCIETSIGYVYPRTELPIPGTIRYSPSASNDVFFAKRWCKPLQRWEYRILSLSIHVRNEHPPNWGELYRMELAKNSVPGVVFDGSDEYYYSDGPKVYSNILKKINERLLPGQYADIHSAHYKWTWKWLG